MTTYTVTEAISGETNSDVYGAIPFRFQPGEVTPKSEEEEVALKILVGWGFAKVSETQPPEPTPPAEVADATQ